MSLFSFLSLIMSRVFLPSCPVPADMEDEHVDDLEDHLAAVEDELADRVSAAELAARLS